MQLTKGSFSEHVNFDFFKKSPSMHSLVLNKSFESVPFYTWYGMVELINVYELNNSHAGAGEDML